MIKNELVIPMTCMAIVLLLNTFSAKADDCTISITSKESFKCLQRKISILESELNKMKKLQGGLPKGVVVIFNRKSCPAGWNKYRLNKSGVKKISLAENFIKCQKS